jgi:hypothetical protein
VFLDSFYLEESSNVLEVHLYRGKQGSCLQDDGFVESSRAISEI